MSKKWVVAAKKADFDGIAARFGISPYLARIIRNRDFITENEIDAYLNANIDKMHDSALLKDMELSGEIINDAIEAGANIRVIGDYDIDGVCASYILKKGLEFLGAIIDVRLPDRVADGYGLNKRIVEEAANDGIDLIITCDNGIAARDEIEYAMGLGISVIVTDHHEIPFNEDSFGKHYIIPPADAVIDPKQEECQYPYSGICGGMVAYKLVDYMVRKYTDKSYDEGTITRSELMSELLSFAAFATVGDIMELKDENRIAVKLGLDILRNTTNIGMKALIKVTGVKQDILSVYHIGFILGPCINASGRLDTANKALELFMCEDEEEALNIARELSELNESRKNMTLAFADKAIKMVQDQYNNDKVLVVFLQNCHESIAGIVAGRIREKFYKPTIVLTLTEDGTVKGSGRSVEGYDMFEELTKVKEMFIKFGGHKMAAGLSMHYADVDELRRRLNDNTTLTEDDLIEKMVIDIPLPIGYVTMDLVREIDRLAPFGMGNSKPLFAQKDIKVLDARIMGKNQNVLKMMLDGVDASGEHKKVSAVYFGDVSELYDKVSQSGTISILYQVGINEYMGNSSVQLNIVDYMV